MIILVMGVSGSGKTTIGKLLAASLGWQFYDADAFHSVANVEKMRQGIPLTESDRQPWLATLQQTIRQWLQAEQNVVLACSALKASYRQQLLQDPTQMRMVYLQGPMDLLQQRLQERRNHFMGSDLLPSQFQTLEEPEDAIKVEITQSPAAIVGQIRTALDL